MLDRKHDAESSRIYALVSNSLFHINTAEWQLTLHLPLWGTFWCLILVPHYSEKSGHTNYRNLVWQTETCLEDGSQ